MVYKRSKPNASLATLEKLIKEELAKISSYETELAKCRAELLITPAVSEIELNLVKTTLSRLQVGLEVPEPKWHLLRWFVGLEQNKEPKNVLKDEAVRKYMEFVGGELYSRCHRPSKLKYSIQDYESRLGSSRSKLIQLEEASYPMRKKKDSLIELRAAAASNKKETREVGATVRRGLTLQPWCR